MKEMKTENDQLKEENHSLYDNILLLQQKITDELGVQMEQKPIVEQKKTISLKNISIVDDKKKVSQGQGGGIILKSVSGLMGQNKDSKLSDADKKFAQEALEEQQLLESMEQTNKIAQELMK